MKTGLSSSFCQLVGQRGAVESQTGIWISIALLIVAIVAWILSVRRVAPHTKRTVAYAIVTIVLLIPASHFFATLYLDHGNTLYNNGRWESGKMKLGKGLMGAMAFLVTRTGIHANSLNLGTWHGYQEVWYKSPLDISRVEFEFWLAENTWLAFVFNRSETGYQALRFSCHNKFRNALLTVSPEGEFQKYNSLNVPLLQPGWHQCEIVFSDSRDLIECHLDGVAIGSGKVALLEKQYVGFKGSLLPTVVDEVVISPRDSSQTIKETFSNYQNRLSVCIVIAAFLLFLNSALLLLFSRRRTRFAFFLVMVTSLNLNLAGGLWSWADRIYLGYLYPEDVHYFPGLKNNCESPSSVLGQLAKVGPRDENTYRILFVGTSQTWGAGARSDDETFVQRVESILNAQSDNIRFECINCGLPGEDSAVLWEHYSQEWTKLDAQLIVINLANNDGLPSVLAHNLEKFCELNQKEGVQTIIVPEPKSDELTPMDQTGLRFKHQRMIEVANKYQLPLVLIHEHLQGFSDRGFIWWDTVHLTSYGQRLFAEKVCEEIEEHLESGEYFDRKIK